ncbi:hypothetical protein EJ04DRAFT_541440 [Polyplosphaeria fusca]|uniref:Microbial-type PARG catalytic domain-containing protein n=1 Tax=Polyplosphaeria fusca TaxID=682080 RepID=A0A9P4V689_9PLEO|nr:hypothetical protein EJ04DRAFT_541440 [Polyplosphaeria fusca]
MRRNLRQTAKETKDVLPTILVHLDVKTRTSSIHHMRELTPLKSEECPAFGLPEGDQQAGRKGTRIRVFDQDSFDAALDLQPSTTVSSSASLVDAAPATDQTGTGNPTASSPKLPLKPVAVLNLASEKRPGGGWENGALAQEEALCFRSSLYLSLHQLYYPIPALSALYTPTAVLIRDAMSRGHKLIWPEVPTEDLPVTSVISLAAIRRPSLARDGTYAKQSDVEFMKKKIRVVLRLSALQGHTKIVLGALGCGAFANPPHEVAQCFLEVFQEDEFQGGWWEDVVFAVLDNARGEDRGKDGTGNYGVFYRALEGVVV